MQAKTFRFYVFAVPVHSRGHMHLEAGGTRRTRHGQPMRNEIPVLGHQIDDARCSPYGRSAHRLTARYARAQRIHGTDDVIKARGSCWLVDKIAVWLELIKP